MNNEKRTSNKYYTPGTPNGAGSIWKYIIFFLLIWFVISYVNSMFSVASIKLPYSVFKTQVKKDNVKSIVLQGNDIHGDFKSAYISQEDSVKYQKFSSVKPAFNDPELIGLLEKHSVTITAETEGNSWLPYILIMILPWVLIIGYFMYVRNKMQGNMKIMMGSGAGLFGIGKSKAKKYRKSDSGVTFDDVAGLKHPKKDLREIVDYLKEPEKFKKLGADVPKGILLMGKPGTGKTLLARATAGEAGVPFYSISGSEFIEMFVGVGASRVRDLFENAKKEAPAIIFIDEVDSIGRSRGTGLGGGHDEREQTLNQILSEMDGFVPNQSVVVIAATNRPDVLDPALIRPGRFDRQIMLELPQKKR